MARMFPTRLPKAQFPIQHFCRGLADPTCEQFSDSTAKQMWRSGGDLGATVGRRWGDGEPRCGCCSPADRASP
eukprot:353182-Chlamydomonas_euryale.AAC.6